MGVIWVCWLDGWMKAEVWASLPQICKGRASAQPASSGRGTVHRARRGIDAVQDGRGAFSHPTTQLDFIMAPPPAAAGSNGASSSPAANSDLDFLNQVLSASTQNQQPPDWAAIVDGLKLRSGLSDASEEELANLDEASVAALLQKLEQADVVSDAMERRLDALLGDLDGLLGGLAGPDSASASTQRQTEGGEPEQEQDSSHSQETVDVNGGAGALSPALSAETAEQDDKV